MPNPAHPIRTSAIRAICWDENGQTYRAPDCDVDGDGFYRVRVYDEAAYNRGVGDLIWDGDAGGDVALPPAANTWATDWLDVRDYHIVSWFVSNTGGANNITGENCYFSPKVAGAPSAWNGAAQAVAPGVTYMTQEGTFTAGTWDNGYFTPCAFAAMRIQLVSAVGTNARVYVMGKRL